MDTYKPLPELAANKALNEIKIIARTQLPPDQFTYLRLERMIKSSIPIDAAASYSILGALEAVSGSEELMHQNHKNSIQLSNDPLMHLNYAASLAHFSRMKEAAEQSLMAVALSEGNIDAIRNAIINTTQYGAISASIPLIEKYKKLLPDDVTAYVNITSAAALQRNLMITDEEIIKLVDIACDLMRKKRIVFINQTIEPDFDDEGFLSVCINLNLPVKEIIKLNRELFELMLSQNPDQPAKLSVRFARAQKE